MSSHNFKDKNDLLLMLNKKNLWIILLLVCIISNIILRLHLIELFSQYPIQAKDPGTDESGYINLGLHFWSWLLHGNAIRLPLYPAFLALFVQNGMSEKIIYITQHILFISSALTLCFVLFDNWSWRFLVLTIILFYGPFMTNPNGALTETFTISLLMFAIVCSISCGKNRWGQLGGAFLFGLLSLTRPNFLYLFPLILLLQLVKKQISFKSSILLVIIFALPVFSWMMRNYAIQGKMIYCTVGGEQLYRESRIMPPYYSDDLKFFNEVLEQDRPDNLKVSFSQIWRENIYHDNRYNYLPIDSNYPLKNDVRTDQYYKKTAKENYKYYLKNRFDLLFNKVSLWIRNYPTTCMATFEYLAYRNSDKFIHSRVIDLLYIIATLYDIFFFPMGLLMILLLGICILRFPSRLKDLRSTTILYAILFYSLFFPIPTQIGGRFTMIYMMMIIIISLYFISRYPLKTFWNEEIPN